MKKILFTILAIIFLCSCSKDKLPSDIVKEYLNDFVLVNDNIKNEINDAIDINNEFNSEHKKLYKEILIKQYKSLKYDVLREEYDDDKALITVNVNVYDLNKAEEEALEYLSDNLSEFYNESNVFDEEKYISYKLNLMKKTTSRIDYEIIFYLKRENSNWVLEQPTDVDLEKIHGIYKE